MNGNVFAGVQPFLAVADAGSFTGAAARLGVSTAAVSKAIAKLEGELGVTLVERTSRRVALSADGRAYLERCRTATAAMEAARDEIATARGTARGELRVTAPFILGRRIVAALPRLLGRHAALSVRLQLTDRRLDPTSETDVAVRIGDLPDSRLVARRLGATRWITLASPDYLARRGVPRAPSDLQQHECLRFLAGSGRPRPWTFVGAEAHPVSGRVVLDQGELLLEAALAGVGLCQVLDFMVDPEVHGGRLVEVLGDHAAQGPRIHAVATAGRMRSANVRALLAALSVSGRRG